jgi:hypothetical protein
MGHSMGMNIMQHDVFNCFVFQRAQAEGRLREQRGAVLSLQEELRRPMYKNAEKEYLEKIVQKKVG